MRKPAATARARATMLVLALSACDTSAPGKRTPDDAQTITTGAVVSSISADGANEGGASAAAPLDARLRREMVRADQVASSQAANLAQTGAGSAATDAASAPPAPTASPSVNDAQFQQGVSLGSADAANAMLVRQGQATVEVARVDDAVTRVRQGAARFSGFVANTALASGKDDRRSASLEVRVPTAQFDALLASLGELGKVESVTAQVQDMSEEYVDLGARLTNARRVEARLIEMLATRTGKLSDVLTVEQELARVRMEAERYDARIKWIERRSALSSLNITIHEKLPLIDSRRGPGPIAMAVGEAWANTVGVVAWFIASLGVLIPLGVVIAAGYLLARRVLRGRRPPGVSEA